MWGRALVVRVFVAVTESVQGNAAPACPVIAHRAFLARQVSVFTASCLILLIALLPLASLSAARLKRVR
jgi:hypothetical protein